MERIFSNDNLLIVHNFKNLLEQSGISCELRNDFISSASGEVPPIEAWPEIWVEPRFVERAKILIDEASNPPASAVSWMCYACSEENGPAFDFCWKCGEQCPP